MYYDTFYITKRKFISLYVHTFVRKLHSESKHPYIHTYICVQAQSVSLDVDFQMALYSWTNLTNNSLKPSRNEREKVRDKYGMRKQNQRDETWRRRWLYDEGKDVPRAQQGLETRQRWPEFRRSGKSAGKIHGSLCRAAVWQIVCVYKTHFAGTYCRAFFSSDFIADERLARNLSAKSEGPMYTSCFWSRASIKRNVISFDTHSARSEPRLCDHGLKKSSIVFARVNSRVNKNFDNFNGNVVVNWIENGNQ